MLSLHPLSWMTFSFFRVPTYWWQIPFHHSSLGVCVVLGSAGALFAVHKHLLWHLHFGTRCQPCVYFDEMLVHAAPVDI